MRTVIRTAPGVVELNWMWLPTFIGMNAQLKTEIEERLKPKLEGQPLTGDTLDKAHTEVISFLLEKFPDIKGLNDYLDALKYVEDGNPQQEG